MSRILQNKASRGSQMWLQALVDHQRESLDGSIRESLHLGPGETIDWLSPLETDGHAEYRDDAFLDRLSIELVKRPLSSFWPRGGPVWDGLARTSRDDILLVEAKSHVSELRSSCHASDRTRGIIRDSLAEAAAFYQSRSPENWMDGYYQYANRLAHLYLVRHLNNRPAWLVFVYFVNDTTMSGPKSVAEWHDAITSIHDHLGITPEQMGPYVIDLFPDVTSVVSDDCRAARE